MEPIRKALEGIDAERFMSLQRVHDADGSGVVQNNGGACLRQGVKVHPIHGDITPKRRDLDKPGSSIVRYLHVTELENRYSVGIFVFSPNAVIPLHDHPGMSVLSRVMYGSLTVKSYDILPEEDDDDKNGRQCSFMSLGGTSAGCGGADDDCCYDSTCEAEDGNILRRGSSWLSSLFRPIARTVSGVSSVSSFYSTSNKPATTSRNKTTTSSSSAAAPLLLPEGSKKAIQKPIRHLSAPGLSILFPHEGNAHEFVAGEHGAAVLDVLLPPYCCEHDRNCTFYKAVDENGDDFVGDTVVAASLKNKTKARENEEEGNDDETMESSQSTNSEESCWLKPVPAPSHFHCISGQYADLGCR
uniref:Cysteine dioxygenase n=1 Tax=Helicotheca tamesis TaxID=374047 RepID=A0A7S2MEQ8_9STRA